MYFRISKKDWLSRQKYYDPGRDRTCNLLLRRQTRYPLRHWTLSQQLGFFKEKTYYLQYIYYGDSAQEIKSKYPNGHLRRCLNV